MVTFSWLVELQVDRVELRFGIAVSGILYVMISGASMMQTLYANNWDIEEP